METAVCADGRARGMSQFYGANRTGRWAGRIIQMQNLPQNHLVDLAEARSLVHNGDFNAVEMLYEDVPDTLSQLIRTAFVPQGDRKFIVDESGIDTSFGVAIPLLTFSSDLKMRTQRIKDKMISAT